MKLFRILGVEDAFIFSLLLIGSLLVGGIILKDYNVVIASVGLITFSTTFLMTEICLQLLVSPEE